LKSNGAGVALARPDAHDLRKIENEDFSVSDLSGLSRFDDRLDHQIDERIVTPCTPTSLTACRTSSSLNGLIIAVMSFIE
jgi:hypothetical protein